LCSTANAPERFAKKQKFLAFFWAAPLGSPAGRAMLGKRMNAGGDIGRIAEDFARRIHHEGADLDAGAPSSRDGPSRHFCDLSQRAR
jgi:hypothetical protein